MTDAQLLIQLHREICNAEPTLKDYRRCGFCGSLFLPPPIHRAPSEACDKCWLEIQRQKEKEK